MIKKPNDSYLRIEYPMHGATYHKDKYGVYEYDTYPRGSVLGRSNAA